MDFESDEDISEMEKKNETPQRLWSQKANEELAMPGPSGLNLKHGAKKEKKKSAEFPSSEKKAKLEESDTETDNESDTSQEYDSENSYESSENENFASNEPQNEEDYLEIDGEDLELDILEPLYKPNEKGKNKQIIGKENVDAENQGKGKPSFTGFMLWSNEIRKKINEKYPNEHFSSFSKRLNEVWACIPSLEKNDWARRAKERLMVNPTTTLAVEKEHTWKVPTPILSNKFTNKNQKLKNAKTSMAQRKKKLTVPPTIKNLQISRSSHHKNNDSANKSFLDKETTQELGLKPIDVAAHLTLLGESMTAIGNLLIKRDGDVSMSGSLSVLLDSLICAMNALMCMMQEVPEVNGADPKTLAKMLDNVAYIMPGV